MLYKIFTGKHEDYKVFIETLILCLIFTFSANSCRVLSAKQEDFLLSFYTRVSSTQS